MPSKIKPVDAKPTAPPPGNPLAIPAAVAAKLSPEVLARMQAMPKPSPAAQTALAEAQSQEKEIEATRSVPRPPSRIVDVEKDETEEQATQRAAVAPTAQPQETPAQRKDLPGGAATTGLMPKPYQRKEKRDLTPEEKKARSEKQNAWQRATKSESGRPIVSKEALRGKYESYVVKILVKENPRQGVAGWRFAQYRDHMSVADIRENAAPGLAPTLLDLVWDQVHDFIEIVELM